MAKEKDKKVRIVLSAATLALVASLALVLISRSEIQSELQILGGEVEQQRVTVLDYEDLLAEQEEQLEVHKELLRIMNRQSANTAYDFSQIRQMVSQATQTIEDLKKLEEADKELLAKYSKVYFLNEHYAPENLVYVPSESVASERNQQVKGEVLPFLNDMFVAMEASGLSPRVISAFRSFGYQENLKNNHSVTYGTNVSNQFVADQGYSEHQLGTTVDIVNTEIGSNMLAFDGTEEYRWLLENAHEYGFTLSYPHDNGYYVFEPWHWRFIGVELATQLHKDDKHFYDIPQRDIDAYRINMFDILQ